MIDSCLTSCLNNLPNTSLCGWFMKGNFDRKTSVILSVW